MKRETMKAMLVAGVLLAAVTAWGANFFDPTARSTVTIPDPVASSTQSLGTQGSYTMTTGADTYRVDWSCDANDSPTFTAVPVKVQLAVFDHNSSNGTALYTTKSTFRYAATGSYGVHPLTKKMVFTKISSATAATCRYWVQ